MGWKAVRNKNKALCEARGISGAWRKASHEEAIQAFKRKVGEEYLEFIENGDPGELLDMQDALRELLSLLGPAKAPSHGVCGTWASHEQAVKALRQEVGEKYLEFVGNGDPAWLLGIQDALTELLRLLDPAGQYSFMHTVKVAEQGRFSDHIMWSPWPGEPVPAAEEVASAPHT